MVQPDDTAALAPQMAIEGIHLRFGGVTALSDITFPIYH